MGKLTDKQEMFCKEYVIDLNATQAAIRAGYSGKTAQKIGSENLSKPVIVNRIAELSASRNEKMVVDAEWVLAQAIRCFKKCDELDEMTTARGFLELCGKHITIGAFSEKHDHTSSDGSMSPNRDALEARLIAMGVDPDKL
jgi:hypothetical protein